MLEYLTTWVQLKNDRRAVTALEYGLIAGAIAVAIIAVLGTVGTGLIAKFTAIAAGL
jgi:pilus assembly protein Flp/PilA